MIRLSTAWKCTLAGNAFERAALRACRHLKYLTTGLHSASAVNN